MKNLIKHKTLLTLSAGLLVFGTGCEPNAEEYDADTDDSVASSSAVADNNASMNHREAETASEESFQAVQLDFDAPDTLRVGEQTKVRFTLENVSDYTVHNVSIQSLDPSLKIEAVDAPEEDTRSEGSRSEGSRPDADNTGLSVGSIEPGASTQVRAYISGEKVGTVEKCFAVDYMPGYCVSIEVVQPELEFERAFVTSEGEMTEEDYLCADLFAVYRVRNVGSGASRPITVTEEFAEGLKADGQNSINKSIGSLEAGESWEERYALSAEGPVKHTGIAYASTEMTRLKSSEASVTLNEAEIKLSVDGPKNHKMFRTARYQIKVHNPGEVVAKDIVLNLDTGDFSDADYQFDTQLESDDGEFELGDIGPGENVTILMAVDFANVGGYSLTAMADGYCVADSQRASVRTQVEGVPALRLEMIDTNDPVIVGEMTEYRVQIKNQGSARDTDVMLSLELPEGLEFVNGDGATEVSRSNGALNFGKVSDLGPGDSVEWTISVRATSSGKVQTTATMKSKAITSGVSEDEPTNIVSAQRQ